MVRRPLLAAEGIRTFFALRERGRLAPSRVYLDWRAHTAYGTSDARIGEEDLVHYLRWRRQLRKSKGLST